MHLSEAVANYQRTVSYKDRQPRACVSASGGLESRRQVRHAVTEFSQLGPGPGVFSDSVFGMMARPFEHGG